MSPTIDRQLSIAQLRRFGLVMLLGCGLIGALLWWLGAPEGTQFGWSARPQQWIAMVVWGIGVAGTLCAFVSVRSGRAFYVGWMSLALAIRRVAEPVMFTMLFALVLAPFSLIRLTDPLRRRLRSTGTYWEPVREYEHSIDRLKRQF